MSLLSDTATATGLPTRTRIGCSNPSFSVAGVDDLANGSREVMFSVQGGFTGGPGEAALSPRPAPRRRP